MKDLEKIKSEDLGCQVQDANPANFAIEQEVAQLVGATVPQPTQPSADDARELPAQLLVFLRRALLPIRSALRTAVAAIYAHLDSRCTDYTPAAYDPFRLPAGPYDPMRPLIPRTLPNLLTALTAFDGRKISNGSAPNDGIPDGTSLAHLLCSAERNSVTEIKDDNRDWKMNTQFPWSAFPNLTKATFNCVESGAFAICPSTTIAELYLPYLVKISGDNAGILYANNNVIEHLYLPEFKGNYTYGRYGRIAMSCNALKDILMPKFEYVGGDNGPYNIRNCAALERVQMGKIVYNGALQWYFPGCPELIDVEIGAGTNVSLNLSGWDPTNVLSDADKTATFLQNFREHIALRLTSNGSGLTLTLSQAVRDAIHAAEATYGIEAIIVTQKGWTLSPAPTA